MKFSNLIIKTKILTFNKHGLEYNLEISHTFYGKSEFTCNIRKETRLSFVQTHQFVLEGNLREWVDENIRDLGEWVGLF